MKDNKLLETSHRTSGKSQDVEALHYNKRFNKLGLVRLDKRRYMAYWHQTADERHSKPTQGNQELFVVINKVGRPPIPMSVWGKQSKSMECDIFPSVL